MSVIPDVYTGRNGASNGESAIGELIADATGKSFRDFLLNVQHSKSMDSDRKYAAQKRLNEVYKTGYGVVEKAALGESSGQAGGYAVPLDYSTKLMRTIAEESFIFPRANIVPFVGRETYAPRIDVETLQSASTSPFFGGMKFVWGSEQAPTETEPTFRDMSLIAWDLLGYCRVSNQWLMDSAPVFEDKLIKLFGRAAAWYAEYAFLQGTGTAALMPLGVLNSPAIITVTRQVASQISNVDIASMSASLLPFSWKSAIWVASPGCLAQIVKLTNYFLNQGEQHSEGGHAGTLLTRPLFISEKLATLGTQGDLILFDPSLYVIGMRSDVVVDFSPDSRFQNYQGEYRIWLRADGKPQVSKQITLADATTKVSPYVVLL